MVVIAKRKVGNGIASTWTAVYLNLLAALILMKHLAGRRVAISPSRNDGHHSIVVTAVI